MHRLCNLLFVLLCFANAANASDIIGNGGDVVDCPGISNVEMLDLYEGRTVRGLNFDTSLSTFYGDEKEIVENALKRLAEVDPIRANQYIEWARSFQSEMRLVPNADLTDIPDSNHLAVPTGCTIEQVAIQAEPRFSRDPRYLVSEKLWNRMDRINKASLILHELFYREALALGHTNSIATRFMNSFLTSEAFLTDTKPAYFEATTQAKFYMVIALDAIINSKPVYLDTRVSLNSEEVCKVSYLKDLRPMYDSSMETLKYIIAPAILTVIKTWLPNDHYLSIGFWDNQVKTSVRFYDNGQVSKISSAPVTEGMSLCRATN